MTSVWPNFFCIFLPDTLSLTSENIARDWHTFVVLYYMTIMYVLSGGVGLHVLWGYDFIVRYAVCSQSKGTGKSTYVKMTFLYNKYHLMSLCAFFQSTQDYKFRTEWSTYYIGSLTQIIWVKDFCIGPIKLFFIFQITVILYLCLQSVNSSIFRGH